MTSQTLSGVLGTLPGLSSASDTKRQAWARPDGRRTLQLALATLWLLDGVLQLQSFFFTRSFGLQMISGMSIGNPSFVARPIAWSATTIGHHAVFTDACFALAQITIAVAIAWGPTVKIGLGASVAWAVGVWWIGEGLGGVLNGTADPVNGAPGAVMIYALLAVLLWPTDRGGAKSAYIAARARRYASRQRPLVRAVGIAFVPRRDRCQPIIRRSPPPDQCRSCRRAGLGGMDR